MATSINVVPITLLEAVNVLLREVSLSDATTLAILDQDGDNALAALNDASTNVQKEVGWWGATEDFVLNPDTNGNVVIPPNWLEVRPTRGTSTYNMMVSNRGGKLYDLKAHSFIFTVPSVALTVVQALDFEQLPQALRWYILATAGRQFAVGTYPTSGTFRFTDTAVVDAKAAALQENQDLQDVSLQGTSPHFARMRNR